MGIELSKLKYLNQRFQCNNGEYFTVIEYNSAYDITILFDDGTKMFNQRSGNINRGKIKNLNSLIPTFNNIGYMGIGKYTSNHFSFNIWHSMIQRCYDKNSYKTYIDCLVNPIWHNFQNFALWCENSINGYTEGFHLDKDILVKGNKIYGPDTCCFVPQEINNLFCKANKARGNLPIGVHFDKNRNKFKSKLNIKGITKNLGRFNTIEEAFQIYKEAKEKYIKWMALTWFVQKKQITEKVYLAMYNYQVEITD